MGHEHKYKIQIYTTKLTQEKIYVPQSLTITTTKKNSVTLS